MKSIITSRHLYYGSLISTLAVLVVSFTHIAKAVVAFEKGDNAWVAWALAGGTELFLVLTGFGIGEIIKYKASQKLAKQKHSVPLFPQWMLNTLISGLVFFVLWILWGNLYYTSVVAVNEMTKSTEWISVITWDNLMAVDKFHLVNSYISALPLPVMAFLGSMLQTIFDVAAQRIETNSAKSVGARSGGGGKGRSRKTPLTDTDTTVPSGKPVANKAKPTSSAVMDAVMDDSKSAKIKRTRKTVKKNVAVDEGKSLDIDLAEGTENTFNKD